MDPQGSHNRPSARQGAAHSKLRDPDAEPAVSQEARSKAAAIYAAQQQEIQAQKQVVIRPVPAAHQAPAAKDPGHAAGHTTAALPTLEQLASAPRYGLNARELILQAAAQVSQPPARTQPASKAAKAKRASAPSASGPAHGSVASSQPQLNPSKLCDAIALADRPFVQYVPRSNIPRLARQGTSDTLLGKYLALLLAARGITEEAQAVQSVKSEEVVRKLASSAAAAHETSIYKQVTSKNAYTDAAGKSSVTKDTLLQFADAAALDAFLKRFNLGADKLDGRDAAGAGGQATTRKVSGSAGGGKHSVLQDLFGDESEGSEGSDCDNEEYDPGSSPNGQEPVPGGQQQQCSRAVSSSQQPLQSDPSGAQGVDAHGTASCGDGSNEGGGVDGLGHSSQEPAPTEPATRLEAPGMQSDDMGSPSAAGEIVAGSEPDQHDTPGKRPGSEPDTQDETVHKKARVATTLQLDPPGQSAQPHPQEQPAGDTAAQPVMDSDQGVASRGNSQGSGYTGVAAQVAEFVRGVLDPLYRANLLTKQTYKEIVRKAVTKIMGHHVGATSAAFLLMEHESVRRYVMKLVETMADTA